MVGRAHPRRGHLAGARSRWAACAAAAVAVLAALALAACSGGARPDRVIEGPAESDRQLTVEGLTLGYPDGMDEVAQEAEAGILPSGFVPFAEAKGVKGQDVLLVLSAAEPGSGKALADVEAECGEVESAVGTPDRFGTTRTAFSKERAVVNGMPCLVLDVTLRTPSDRTVHGIFYVLADRDGSVIGQVAGYFENGAYEKDPARYDSVFASVRPVDGADKGQA